MMDKTYIKTVRLLLEIAPAIFETPNFAMKGGTAINLFVENMPRLSVDIDVVYTNHMLGTGTEQPVKTRRKRRFQNHPQQNPQHFNQIPIWP